jgi:hypothetical protein
MIVQIWCFQDVLGCSAFSTRLSIRHLQSCGHVSLNSDRFETRRPKSGVGSQGWVDDKQSEFLPMRGLRPHPFKPS